MNFRVVYTSHARTSIAEQVDYLRRERVADEVIENWFSALFDAIDNLYELLCVIQSMKYRAARPAPKCARWCSEATRYITGSMKREVWLKCFRSCMERNGGRFDMQISRNTALHLTNSNGTYYKCEFLNTSCVPVSDS